MVEGQKIRGIVIGDSLTGKRINIGHKHNVAGRDLEVVAISQDEDALNDFGLDVFNVYVKDTLGWGEIMLWQTFRSQPVSLTYECGG